MSTGWHFVFSFGRMVSAPTNRAERNGSGCPALHYSLFTILFSLRLCLVTIHIRAALQENTAITLTESADKEVLVLSVRKEPCFYGLA